MKTPGSIVGCQPVGNNLLVEQLTDAEAMGTSLSITDSKSNVKQGYVVAAGPKLDESYGINIGDRILYTMGHGIEVPSYGKSTRKQGIIDPSAVKVVLKEK